MVVGCAQQTLNLENNVADAIVATLQAQVAERSEWNIHLRVALKHKKWSWRGTMQWQQRDDNFNIVFNNLMGRRLLLIESLDDGGVVAVDAKGYRQQASNATLLIKSILGAELPLENLHYWLSGVPYPNTLYNQLEFNAQGLLQSYQQDGWTIDYTAYYPQGCMNGLPSNINLSDAHTRLWLHIQQWQTPQNTIKTSTCS